MFIQNSKNLYVWNILTKLFVLQVCFCIKFNLGLLQIEACEETSIVPKGSDIEILLSAKNNSSSKDKHQRV